MCALIWYEINKMLTDTAAKYVFAVLALWTVFSIYTDITQYRCNANEMVAGKYFGKRSYTGLKAIREIKKRYRHYTVDYTEFSVDTFRAAYRVCSKLHEDFAEEAQTADWSAFMRNERMERNSIKAELIYPLNVLCMVNTVAGLQRLEPAEEAIPDNFYDILFDMRAYDNSFAPSQFEQELLRQKCNGLSVPFRFEYCAGWEWVSGRFHRFAYWLPAIMLAFFALILKYEDESGMESFAFTTKYGRTKAVYAKTIAGLCTIAFLYTAASFIYAAGILSIFGPEGGSCPVQIAGWTYMKPMPVYAVNLIQCCLLQYFLGLLVTVQSVLFFYFIFSLCRNYVISLIAFLIPCYGVSFFTPPANAVGTVAPIQKYIEGIGVNALQAQKNFCGLIQGGDFIYFFGTPVLRVYGLIIIYAAVSVLLAGMSMYTYGRCRIH